MTPHPIPRPRLMRSITLLALLLSFSAGAEPPSAAGCADCHGAAGVSTEPDIATIAGLSAEYLKETLGDYRDGDRPCPESKYRAGDTARAPTDMCKLAKGLTEEEIGELATYFAGLTFVRAEQTADAGKAAVGAKLHKLHCEKCHADGGSSADDDSGILAGQWMPYLRNSLKEFTEGARTPPKKMKPKLEELSAEDLEALVHYYGSQQ